MSILVEINKLLPILKNATPLLTKVLGGGYGMALSILVPIFSKAFNVNSSNFSDIVEAIIKDPEAEKKLKEIEHEHADWLCTLLDSASSLIEAEINIKLKWSDENR
jgi:hypothetical protein